MEATTLVAKALLTRAKSAEVFGRFRYDLGEKLEDDSSRWACAGHGGVRMEGLVGEIRVRSGFTIVHGEVEINLGGFRGSGRGR